MKPFTNRILICTIPVILSLGVIAWAYNLFLQGKGGFRLGPDLAGGTTLIYEVDPKKQLGDVKVDELAAALKRRIDPADLYNITVRPIPSVPPRVEVVLPTGGRQAAAAQKRSWDNLISELTEKFPPGDKAAGEDNPYRQVPQGQVNALIKEVRLHAAADIKDEKERAAKVKEAEDFVRHQVQQGGEKRSLDAEAIENIMNLISQQGRLEFRILANTRDDGPAIDAAKAYLRNPANHEKLNQLARDGDPPPPPRNADGGTEFTINLHGETEKHTYSWIEVGKDELYSLHLNSAFKKVPGSLWWQAASARGEQPPPGLADAAKAGAKVSDDEAEPAPVPEDKVQHNPIEISSGFLLYSRRIPDTRTIPAKDKRLGKKVEYFLLVRDPEPGKEITGDYLSSAKQGPDERGRLAVHFTFKTDGANLFYELTSRNKKDGDYLRHLAIVLDGQIRSAPSLQSSIRSSGQITGEFTKKEVENLVSILRAGALPATLNPEPAAVQMLGATLGEDTIASGTWSVVGAFFAVVAFMVFYYRFAGIVACIALFANLLLTVAFMVLVNATFTLPGLAGLVLMLGMAVDANVLIYERLREERERGASWALAIRNGYDRAFPTIIDTHLSSIFTAIILYVVGNDQLKGFGISLTVGLIISLFTSLYMTRLMFDIWLAKGWLTKLSFRQLFHRPNINFMAIRYYFFAATVLLTIAGATLCLVRSESMLSIDFRGGTAYSGELSQMMTIGELRHELAKADLEELSIDQIFLKSEEYSQGNKSRLFTVRTPERDADKVQKEISRCLGDKLRRMDMTWALHEPGTLAEGGDSKNKEPVVVMSFTDPAREGKPAYASPEQVKRLLLKEFEKTGVPVERTFKLAPVVGDHAEEGRLARMQFPVARGVSRDALTKALDDTKQEFADRPIPERLEKVDKTLAGSKQEQALYAILLSWGALLLYLWFRFGSWTFGMAAVLCLIHDLFFTLGGVAAAYYVHGTWLGNLLAIQDFKIDLPSVAALLTLVGYSVSDTIVVFDRIREVRGKNPALTPQMINDSVNQTLSRTVLSSLTIWLVVTVLYVWGGEGVHMFAYVMVIGVIVGTYSSIYIASPLLLIFGEGAKAPPVRERAPEQPATR